MIVFAVAMNTFRETVRDHVLYVLLFLATVTIGGSKMLGWVSVGQDNKIIIDISLASLSVFGALIAIFVGSNLVHKEIDKRTIYTIVCRPIWRFEFILGKYIGLAVLLGVVVALLTVVVTIYVTVLGGSLSSAFFVAILLTYWKLLIVTAMSVLLSSLTSPILGAIMVFTAYIFCHATVILIDLPGQMKGNIWEPLMRGLYYIVPNFSNFNVSSQAANQIAIAPAYVLWTLAYGTMYVAVLLILAALAFEDKDI